MLKLKTGAARAALDCVENETATNPDFELLVFVCSITCVCPSALPVPLPCTPLLIFVFVSLSLSFARVPPLSPQPILAVRPGVW